MTVEPTPPAVARESANRQVTVALRPMLRVTLWLLIGYVLVTPFLYEFPKSLSVMIAEAGLAFAFRLGSVALGRDDGHHRVHALFFILMVGALTTTILTYFTTSSELLSLAIILLIVGTGIIVLSWPWLVATLSVCVLAWVGALFAEGADSDLPALLLTMGGAVMLSAVAHAARMSAHTRIESLRERDAMQRRELESNLVALREATAQLGSVVRAAPVTLLAVDLDGRVTLAEGKGLAARGWGDRASGRSARELLAPYAEELAGLERALSGKPAAGVASAGDRIYEFSWTPAQGALGETVGAIGVSTDVTERVRIEQERRVAAERESTLERLREMDRFKTSILNTASHELNTPLTPIKLQMHLLKSSLSHMDEKQQRALTVLDRNVDRLASLVGDIMDVARLQGGGLRVALVSAELAPIVGEAFASFEAVAKTRGIMLTLEPGPPVHVMADSRRLLQVLFNLLSNAMKFTPRGGRVTIETRVEDGVAFVRVRDTGPGLTQEQIGKLFLPFSQVHDVARSEHGGTGLGLYISRGIAEQHGGTLTCESEGPGRGSTFTLRLPVV